MTTDLSWWQKIRHNWLVRSIESKNAHREGIGAVLLRDDTMADVTAINGYIWTLYDGRTVTAADIVEVGDPKWLYKLHC